MAGNFGVFAHAVEERRREIRIRMALGIIPRRWPRPRFERSPRRSRGARGGFLLSVLGVPSCGISFTGATRSIRGPTLGSLGFWQLLPARDLNPSPSGHRGRSGCDPALRMKTPVDIRVDFKYRRHGQSLLRNRSSSTFCRRNSVEGLSPPSAVRAYTRAKAPGPPKPWPGNAAGRRVTDYRTDTTAARAVLPE